MSPEVINQFAEYGGYIGLLTVAMVLGLGSALIYLWRFVVKMQSHGENNQKENQKCLLDLQKEFQSCLIEVQDRRVEEMKESQKVLRDINEENNKVIRSLTEALHTLKDVVISRKG